MSEHIAEFLKNDEAKVEEMIKKYPITIHNIRLLAYYPYKWNNGNSD